MATVVVSLPGTWMSTSPTALDRGGGIVHIAKRIYPYASEHRWKLNPPPGLAPPDRWEGEMAVMAICGTSFDGVPDTGQQREMCKRCSKVKELPTTIQSWVAPPVTWLDERDVPESPERNGQETLRL